MFDVNDFDETLPGPFEWDVKRLAASLAVAGRDNGFPTKERRRVVLAGGRSYRTAMREFAGHAAAGRLVRPPRRRGGRRPSFESQLKPSAAARLTEKAMAKARTRDSMQALGKLTTVVDGQRRIISDPPLIVPVEELVQRHRRRRAVRPARDAPGRSTARTLQSDRRHLLEQFTLVHVARKVVGVGSVGTRAWILLLDAGDGSEPLFLQAKEAQPSVLADYCGHSKYDNQGERVVAGQHLMQAASDIFLGWQRTDRPRRGRPRLLRAPAARLEVLRRRSSRWCPPAWRVYAGLCGWTLARAHARSGDRIAIAAYLGKSDAFDVAIARLRRGLRRPERGGPCGTRPAVADGLAEAQAPI